MSQQRKAVYWVLIALCLLVNWGMFRLHPRWKELAALDAQLEARAGDHTGAEELARMVAELERLERELEPAGTSGSPGLDAGDPSETGLALADLASRCGLYLESSSPQAAPAAGTTQAQDSLAGKLAKAHPQRPLLRWSAWGDFAGLLAFLEALPALPGQPVVLELQVDRVKSPAPAGVDRPPLQIRLLLAA